LLRMTMGAQNDNKGQDSSSCGIICQTIVDNGV
jgi:hypothetical protein